MLGVHMGDAHREFVLVASTIVLVPGSQEGGDRLSSQQWGQLIWVGALRWWVPGLRWWQFNGCFPCWLRDARIGVLWSPLAMRIGGFLIPVISASGG
jgi:hypothetical protein